MDRVTPPAIRQVISMVETWYIILTFTLTLYLVLGWVAVWYTRMILHNAGMAATVLLAVGGALYSVGALFYGLRWPDPWPTTFGYHELFHACTAVAAICQYIAIWLAVF